MTKGTASNSYASPQLQDAISRLEKMHSQAREEVLEQEYLVSKGEPEKSLRDAQSHARRVRDALRWARRRVRGTWQSLLLLLLKYYLALFVVDFGHDLWKTDTIPALGTPDFAAMAFNSAEMALFAGTIFGLMEWWSGRRAYAKVLGPLPSQAETEKRS